MRDDITVEKQKASSSKPRSGRYDGDSYSFYYQLYH